MTEPSQALKDAWAALLDRPSREAVEDKFPSANPLVRAEHSAFIDGALYANDWLIDLWRKLEFDAEPSRYTDAVKEMLVLMINTVGEEARLEADHRFPKFDPPTARDIQLGKDTYGRK